MSTSPGKYPSSKQTEQHPSSPVKYSKEKEQTKKDGHELLKRDTSTKAKDIDNPEPEAPYFAGSAGLGFGDDYTIVQRPVNDQNNLPTKRIQGWQQMIESNATWQYMHTQDPTLSLGRAWQLETGAGGDCLFHALSTGYNGLHKTGCLLMEQVREMAADMVTAKNIDEFLNAATSTAEFPVELLKEIESVPERVSTVQGIIRQTGNAYWGETMTLFQLLLHHPQFVKEKLGFGVVRDGIYSKRVLIEDDSSSSSSPTKNAASTSPTKKSLSPTKTAATAAPKKRVQIINRPNIQVEIIRRKDTEHLLYMYNLGNNHWRLFGVVEKGKTNGRVRSVFPITDIPKCLKPFVL